MITKEEALLKIKELEGFISQFNDSSLITEDMIVPGAYFAYVRDDCTVSDECSTLIQDSNGLWFLSGAYYNPFRLYIIKNRSTKEMVNYLNEGNGHIYMGVRKFK